MRTLNLNRSQYQIADDISLYLNHLGYNNTINQNVSVLDVKFMLNEFNVYVRVYWSSTKLHKVAYFTCNELREFNNWTGEVNTCKGNFNSFRELKNFITNDIKKLNSK
jgi:hypothetical protein